MNMGIDAPVFKISIWGDIVGSFWVMGQWSCILQNLD